MDRKTKIVATLGGKRGKKGDEFFGPNEKPVKRKIDNGELLKWFIVAGANIFRLNMSFAGRSNPYGQNEKEYLEWLIANQNVDAKDVAVLGDLPGPKIRLSKVVGEKK